MNGIAHVAGEAALTLAAIWAALLAGAGARTVGLLLASVAVPAALGAIEYSGFPAVSHVHDHASRLVERVAMPALGWAYWRHVGLGQRVALLELALVLAVLLLLAWHTLFNQQALIVGAIGMALGLWASIRHAKREVALFGVAGFGLIVAAGLAIGTQGSWQGIARVDLFHLALALGVLGIGAATRLAGASRA
jgi:hypothetical protein